MDGRRYTPEGTPRWVEAARARAVGRVTRLVSLFFPARPAVCLSSSLSKTAETVISIYLRVDHQGQEPLSARRSPPGCAGPLADCKGCRPRDEPRTCLGGEGEGASEDDGAMRKLKYHEQKLLKKVSHFGSPPLLLPLPGRAAPFPPPARS